MNREILFRGKRVDNGEWVYGFYGEFHNRPINDAPNSCQIFELREDAYLCGSSIGGIWHEVIPSTIGQYTGLIGKNGTRIFEGDILRFGKRNLMVWWNGESFQWQAKEIYGYDVITKENWLDNDWTNIDLGWIASEIACVGKMTTEIIGNIYDNPDMITDKGEG